MSEPRPQNHVVKNCLTHAAHAGIIPLMQMPHAEVIKFMLYLWNEVEKEVVLSYRFSHPIFDVTDAEGQDVRGRILSLPVPEHPTQAHFIGMFGQGENRRVFLLEKTQDDRVAYFLEWTRSSRLHFGVNFPTEIGVTEENFAWMVGDVIRKKLSPNQVIPRAPIFSTSLREFMIWTELERDFMKSRMTSEWKEQWEQMEKSMIEEMENAFARSRTTETVAESQTVHVAAKPWWKFWG